MTEKARNIRDGILVFTITIFVMLGVACITQRAAGADECPASPQTCEQPPVPTSQPEPTPPPTTTPPPPTLPVTGINSEKLLVVAAVVISVGTALVVLTEPDVK